MALAALQHFRHYALDRIHDPKDVDAHHLLDVRYINRVQKCRHPNAGVGDENIDRAQLLAHVSNGIQDLPALTDVSAGNSRPAAGLLYLLG